MTSIGNTNGSFNFFVGPSGNAATSGTANTANGYAALQKNTSGNQNTANGYGALLSNTSGSGNTAQGDQALWSNTSGTANTANGLDALFNNTSGSLNTANGYGALGGNQTGSYNTASGSEALGGIYLSGSYNIALGYRAGVNITSGSSNIDIGHPGLSTDTNIIRIGSGQTATFLAGDVLTTGKISSPMWRATNIINTVGPLGLTNSFTSGGGTLVISASGSGYSSTIGFVMGMQILLDGVVIDSCNILNNVAFNHVAFVPKTIVKSGVAAGTHSLALTPSSFAATDSNDFFNVTVVELPY
jgi:hypothetical protein